jgi:WD40 repeat protein
VVNPYTQQVASVGEKDDIIITDIQSGQQIDKITSFSYVIKELAWSPDGNYLATVINGAVFENITTGYLQILDTGTWNVIYEDQHPSIVDADWQPSTHFLASADFDGNVRLINPKTQVVSPILAQFPHNIYKIRWDLSGRLLADSYASEDYFVMDIATQTPFLVPDSDWTRLLTPNPQNGDFLRLNAYNIEILDPQTWQVINQIGQPLTEGFYLAAQWSPDGEKIATLQRNGTVEIWQSASSSPLLTIHTPVIENSQYFASGFTWSLDSNTLLVSANSPNIEVYSTNTGKHLATLRGHSLPVSALEWSPDGHTLASGSLDGTIILWDYR